MKCHNKIQTEILSVKLVNHKPVRIPVQCAYSGKKGPVLLLISAQHGNEVQGAEIIRRFMNMLQKRPFFGTVCAIPFANPLALHERRPHAEMQPEQMYADDRGHNMNRKWPGKKNGNNTERIAYTLYQQVASKATHVLDIHCWEQHVAPAVLINNIPELKNIAGKLGVRFVCVAKELKPENGLDDYFCYIGKTGICYECSGQYTINEQQIQMGLRVVINYAKLIGILPGPCLKPDYTPTLFSTEVETVNVKTPVSGLFIPSQVSMCEFIKRNTLLGYVMSDTTLKVYNIPSPVSGYLRKYGAGRPNADVALPGRHPYVEEGEAIAQLWKPIDK